MTRTLKALSLGLLAALAVSAFAVVGASANSTAHTGGHFTTDGALPVTLHGEDEGTHQVHLSAFGSTVVNCDETYSGSVSSATVTSVTVTPTYTSCFSGENPVTVNMNGCNYTFTVRNTNASTSHSPVHLACPAGKRAEVIQHGACRITFGSQQLTAGAVYTTILVNSKHAITADITASGISYEKHGFCEFLSPFGTGPHNGASMTGSATLAGIDKNGNPANITATGTNGH